MPYGDPNYAFVSGGCTATSATTAHNLYGTYGGLSNLNAKEVLLILVSASGGDMRLSLNPAGQATNDSSLRIFTTASTFDLPPMTVDNASQITFAREGANNPIAFWTIMRRVP